MIRDYVLLLSWLCTVQGETGYFWHISDIHYDPKYSLQGNTENSCLKMRNNMDREHTRLYRKIAGTFGSYGCDSPWALIESAAQAMREKHGKGIEFVLWTGDALSHAAGMSEELRLQSLKNLTDLLSHTFTEQFVFPVLGHEDLGLNFTQLANLWKHWLPQEALSTFKNTGFYTIEQWKENYRLIFLNTNLWLNVGSVIDNRVPQRSTNTAATDNSSDPLGQWEWFQSILEAARKKRETVYIVGHSPPGVDEREHGAGGLKEKHNTRYLQLVRQYADIIRGQFFGHWHSDTFRVIYSDTGSPVSWIMMAPSITPYRAGGPNNPGLRLYQFEKKSGQVIDYKQYYLNLPEANSIRSAYWNIEYSLLKHYELKEISALTLHDLADRFTQSNDNAFVRYYAANTVSLPREVEEIWGCGGALNGGCALQHYCSVTRLDTDSYSNCVHSYAYALSSTSSPSIQIDLVILYQLLAILLTFLQCRAQRAVERHVYLGEWEKSR
ncbi:acid sphingomyelinase-like phosphodiesterase 3b [Leptopilina heterotoma]|uniref:acid sphingomyelinase-like phosphodiesterase 3b n=1 Tax=Leptopilina heterotoma TaxID=63436 RepID=UPI001CA8CA60|nr:acid sphingomyelinase-like phosphodiesterase 3b [Leptopilina heterotoma]XP_043478648.1 acid sphingomyelinase-like phosphodiesterase 3b [Leptopilina heterotoma]